MEMYQFPPDEAIKQSDENTRKADYLSAINRKRTMPIDNTHLLQAKISKEAAKIIQMKVANDAVKWELQEKVKELEGVRERQQQQLLEVQMQYEKLDGDFQIDLRLREDIMSKVMNTRSICGILGEHFAAVGESLKACQSDRQTLCDSYQRAIEVINELKAEFNHIKEEYTVDKQNLQQQLAVEKQMRDLAESNWSESKKILSEMIEQLKNQINDQLNMISLLKEQRELDNRSLANIMQDCESITNDLTQREHAISSLQTEVVALNNTLLEERVGKEHFKTQCDKQILQAEHELALLKQALSNQDAFVVTINHEKIQLNEKLCQLEETVQHQNGMINDHKQMFMDVSDELEEVKSEKLEFQKNEYILNTKFSNQKTGFEDIRQKLETVCNEKQNIEQELEKCRVAIREEQMLWKDERKNLCDLVDDVNGSLQQKTIAGRAVQQDNANIKNHLDELKNEFNNYKYAADEQIKKMINETATATAELNGKSDTITLLMSQLKSSTDVRAKLEISFQQLNKEMEFLKTSQQDKQALLEDTNQLLKREIAIMKESIKKTSDDNTSLKSQLKKLEKSHVSILNSAKKSKENLTKAVNNDQKKNEPVTSNKNGEFPAIEFDPAPNNGNMTWSIPKKPNTVSQIKPKVAKFSKPKRSQEFLSDSSMDGIEIDISKVSRHFKEIANRSKSPMRSVNTRITNKYNQPGSQLSFLSAQENSGVIKVNHKGSPY